jgi:tetratricopeptide (TPR) repeat protein
VPRLALASARDTARRALDIDGSLYEAHLALGETQRMLDFDWAGAETSYLKALALNPSSESAHRAYALLLSALGRHREAVRESDRAIELDPLCLVVGGAAAWVAYASGDYRAAIEIARNTIDMDPEFVRARRVLAAAYLQSGRLADAVQELETSVALTDHPVLLGWLAHARAITGRTCDAEAIVARMLNQAATASTTRWRSPTSDSGESTRRSTRWTWRVSTGIRCSPTWPWSRASIGSGATRALPPS